MQKDLFGTAAAAAVFPENMSRTSFLDRYRMAIRLDQALFLLIGLLVIYVLVFSFGVETGKRYAMEEIKSERMKRERVAEELREKVFPNTPAVPVSETLKPLPEAAVPEPGESSGKFTIQIMTIASKPAAEKEIKRLSEKGMKGFIIPRGRKNEICINAFESREKASQSLKQLKTRGLVPTDAYVRPVAA